MKSNIKYFLRQSIRLLLISVAYSAFLAFVTYDAGESLEQFVSMFIFGAAIMNISVHIGMYKRDISLALAFGSTRKNLLWGLIFYDLFSIVLIDLVAVVIALVFAKSMPVWGVLLITTIVMLATEAVGTFIGIIFQKFGKVLGIVIMLVFIFALGAGVGFLSYAGMDNGYTWTFLENARNVCFFIAAIVVVIWAIVQFAQSRVLRKYTV